MALSIFTPSVTGMDAHAQAIGSVSTNIANMNTVGYRSIETMFQTLLGTTPATGNTNSGDASSRVGINGVSAHDRTLITQQGTVTATGGAYDVALDVNNGFFMVEDSAGDLYYTRAGNFTSRIQDGVTYLVANNGYFVDGFAAMDKNTFAGAATPIVIDAPLQSPVVPTTSVSIVANVPATGVDVANYAFQVYGANNEGNSVNMLFNKNEAELNTWDVSFVMDNGVATTANPVEVVFDGNGTLLSPKEINVTVTADNGDVNNVVIDIAKMTQYAGDDTITNISQDGRASSNLKETFIDGYGILQAVYDNGERVNIAKLAVVGFDSPENLIQSNGTMFEASNDVGESYFVIGSDTMSSNVLTSQAVESSPVNLEKQFSDLIVMQRAYTLNTTSFTTNNEMLQTTVDILG